MQKKILLRIARVAMMSGAAAVALPSCMGLPGQFSSDESADEVVLVEDEVARHCEALEAMSAVSRLPAEATRHDAAMDLIGRDMSEAMDRMGGHCSETAHNAIRAAMDDLWQEMGAHGGTLALTADLDAARAACADHRRRMSALLDDIRDPLGDMDRCGMHGW